MVCEQEKKETFQPVSCKKKICACYFKVKKKSSSDFIHSRRSTSPAAAGPALCGKDEDDVNNLIFIVSFLEEMEGKKEEEVMTFDAGRKSFPPSYNMRSCRPRAYYQGRGPRVLTSTKKKKKKNTYQPVFFKYWRGSLVFAVCGPVFSFFSLSILAFLSRFFFFFKPPQTTSGVVVRYFLSNLVS